MNYEKIYNRLCNNRKSRGLKKEDGFEIHHILPKSLGGEDRKYNYVKLTKREHVFAHRLLTKFTVGVALVKMKQAYYMMTLPVNNPDYEITRKYLTPLTKRCHTRLPITDFTHTIPKTTSKFQATFCKGVKLEGYKGLQLGWLLDLCMFAISKGFIGLQCHRNFLYKSKNTIWKLAVEYELLTEDASFTPYLLEFYENRKHYRLKVNYFYHCKGSSSLDLLLRILNEGLEGNVILPVRYKRGHWVLIKCTNKITRYDNLLYTVYTNEELRDKLL